MNIVILMGRLTKDVEIRYAQSSNTAIARFTIAVNREYKKEGEERGADFVSCYAFGKTAEFIGKYFGKGSMIAITGRINTGNYTDKDGKTVYTTDVIVDKANFTGEKREGGQQNSQPDPDGFMDVPDNLEDELPFN